MNGIPTDRTVEEAVTCEKCRAFTGLVTSDGRGPLFDDCAQGHIGRNGCPMFDKLDRYQVKARSEYDRLETDLVRKDWVKL